jgi:hypothetical protein
VSRQFRPAFTNAKQGIDRFHAKRGRLACERGGRLLRLSWPHACA